MKSNDLIKQAIYLIAYFKNMVRYANKKVNINFLEVWVGQACTLKCRDCLHMIPYIKPQLYSIDQLILDCKKLFSVCNVDYISVLGGEPFLNKKLYQFLDFIGRCPNIKDGKVITNGTVFPDERTLQSIIQLHNKLDIRIDVYPGSEERSERFYQWLQQRGIRSAIMHHEVFDELHWKWMGSVKQKMKDRRSSQIAFTNCGLRGCYTLANGEFTVCPRGITTEEVFGFPKNPYENIRIQELQKGIRGRAKFATSIESGIYKDYCRYCLGMTKLNPYCIYAGIQKTCREEERGMTWKS